MLEQNAQRFVLRAVEHAPRPDESPPAQKPNETERPPGLGTGKDTNLSRNREPACNPHPKGTSFGAHGTATFSHGAQRPNKDGRCRPMHLEKAELIGK
jgi:hypothetical protein